MNISFSSPEHIVFINSSDSKYQYLNRGILLLKYYGNYAALNIAMVKDDTIFFEYWYNTSGECFFQSQKEMVPPVQAERNLVFRDKSVYELNSSKDFDNIEVDGGATVCIGSDITVEKSVIISDGTLLLKNGSLGLQNLEIKKDGKLMIYFDEIIIIKGDFINNGEFVANAGTVVFNGDTPQTISGEASFYSLEIQNESVVEAGQIDVHELSVYEGDFVPGSLSTFENIFIDSWGAFSPMPHAIIFIGGDMDNRGLFRHNSGTVICSGKKRQYFSMNKDSFYNLFLLNRI